MTEPPLRPTLTPTFCFNTRFLRDFLRLSRSQLDDSISTNLNALLTPSQRGFDPLSTATRNPRSSGGRESIPQNSCRVFAEEVLFPSWQARSDVLSYCAGVAAAAEADPNDLENRRKETQDQVDHDRIVDERKDPYSARHFPRDTRSEQLAALMRNEEAVERIVRSKTWGMIQDRCQGMGGSGRWEDALDKWREETGKSRR